MGILYVLYYNKDRSIFFIIEDELMSTFDDKLELHFDLAIVALWEIFDTFLH